MSTGRAGTAAIWDPREDAAICYLIHVLEVPWDQVGNAFRYRTEGACRSRYGRLHVGDSGSLDKSNLWTPATESFFKSFQDAKKSYEDVCDMFSFPLPPIVQGTASTNSASTVYPQAPSSSQQPATNGNANTVCQQPQSSSQQPGTIYEPGVPPPPPRSNPQRVAELGYDPAVYPPRPSGYVQWVPEANKEWARQHGYWPTFE